MTTHPAEVRTTERPAFAFGRNWRRFVDHHLDSEVIAHAARSLADLLGTDDLLGRSFVDVGCGSGLSSLAARRLGASRIVSFDLEPESVACCRLLREREGAPADWTVLTGSALDETLLRELGRFDLVYSWGVLHHTGEIWRALELVCGLAAADGLLAIAIYNRVDSFGPHPDGRFGPSRMWVPLKRRYCRLPGWMQAPIEWLAVAVFWTSCLIRLSDPRKVMSDYRKQRGMSLHTDIRDWLGGYPYEYASPEEVKRFVEPRGFVLEKLIVHGGLRCNEYLFRRVP